jgi:hypothetical protein
MDHCPVATHIHLTISLLIRLLEVVMVQKPWYVKKNQFGTSIKPDWSAFISFVREKPVLLSLFEKETEISVYTDRRAAAALLSSDGARPCRTPPNPSPESRRRGAPVEVPATLHLIPSHRELGPCDCAGGRDTFLHNIVIHGHTKGRRGRGKPGRVPPQHLDPELDEHRLRGAGSSPAQP